MPHSFSPSTNIIRDSRKQLYYIPTENSRRVLRQIIEDFRAGIHSFNIIGSYGTGKSSFLLAFEKTLVGDDAYFDSLNGHFSGKKRFDFVNIVGEYKSFREVFAREIESNGEIFSKLDQVCEKNKKEDRFLVIVVDEFGKFLEYASGNNPAQELYFVQELAEYTIGRDILFLSTLHQSFDSYSRDLIREQRLEWEKVKGRLKELTFNEPVEQLLLLASEYLKSRKTKHKKPHLRELVTSIEKARAFPLRHEALDELAETMAPMDVLAAAVLTLALQHYGQNERSLFTFLESNDQHGIGNYDLSTNPYYNLSVVYDYLLHNYYSYISTKYNPHYLQWSAIKRAIERVEGLFDDDIIPTLKIIKTVGLLNIFAKDAATINNEFLCNYARLSLAVENADELVERLQERKIIRFLNFKDKYVLFEGTDLDIDIAISEAGSKVEPIGDIVSELSKYFTFPLLPAKAAYYKTGTPRFFKFELSDRPVTESPAGDVDGIVNLIFSKDIDVQRVQEISQNHEEAILYCVFNNSAEIRELLHEIRKIDYVTNSVPDDLVALRELKSIRAHQIAVLDKQVRDMLYSQNHHAFWVYRGQVVHIKDRTAFNQILSKICEEVYWAVPMLKNELINRHKLPASISTARKNFIRALFNHWAEEDIGFPPDRWPPEKTIYYALLKHPGIHKESAGTHSLLSPDDPSFNTLWSTCETFVESARVTKKSLSDFVDLLAVKPLKLKRGLIEFWLPTFLFIKREDFALFSDNGYIPFITPDVIELILKKPQKFQIKTFDVTGVRLELFSKYRQLVNKNADAEFTTNSFVDTIRPFLQFYRQLPEYTKKTKRLSTRAIQLRAAISDATNPEKTFFEDFPRALGYSDLDINANDDYLASYIAQLQETFNELKSCFDNLLDRVERHLLSESGLPDISFPEYKRLLAQRYSAIKKALLLPHQNTFFLRLNSPIEDRRAWLSSIVHAAFGKQLGNLQDQEEEVVLTRLTDILVELDNLCEFSEIDWDQSQEDILKVEISRPQNETAKRLIRVPKTKMNSVGKLQDRIQSMLSKDSKANIAALTILLREQLDNEKS